MWALPVKLNSTDCTHGHCPYSYTLKPGCFQSSYWHSSRECCPQGWGGCSQGWATNLSGSPAGGNLAEMLDQPKLSLLYLAPPQEAVSSFSFSQFICT